MPDLEVQVLRYPLHITFSSFRNPTLLGLYIIWVIHSTWINTYSCGSECTYLSSASLHRMQLLYFKLFYEPKITEMPSIEDDEKDVTVESLTSICLSSQSSDGIISQWASSFIAMSMNRYWCRKSQVWRVFLFLLHLWLKSEQYTYRMLHVLLTDLCYYYL